MTAKQVELVKDSWALVLPVAKEAGLDFYRRLFEAAPGVRHLFKEDYSPQAGKLVAMLGFIVSKLHRLDEVAGDIERLAQAHNGYGAKAEHYVVVGDCLIATLKNGLGERWNPELEDAWLAAYTGLQDAMIRVQAHPRPHTVLQAERKGDTVQLGYL